MGAETGTQVTRSESTDTMQAALAYAHDGILVLPLHGIQQGQCSCGKPKCNSPGKHPRTAHGLKDATTDREQIKAWWGRWPNTNVAIVTGEVSGLIVVDLDVDHKTGEDLGESTLTALQAGHGELPHTVEALTGGGGRHLFFKRPQAPIKNSAGKLGPRVDVRGDGGYVVAPPSMHISGRRYEWEVNHHPDETSIAKLPPNWVNLLGQIGEPANIQTTGRIPIGRRNNSLFAHARRLRVAGATETAIGVSVREQNQKCEEPLDEAELQGIVCSALKRVQYEEEDELPQPLGRDFPPATAYPVDALGDHLGAAAMAIHNIIQSPIALCGQSVLATAALAVQAHADVVIPGAGRRPVSLDLISIAGTGERKTSTDNLALEAVRDYEQIQELQYDADYETYRRASAAWEAQKSQILKDKKQSADVTAKEKALKDMGSAPSAPLRPILTCPEPTYEGFVRFLREGLPSVGIFSNEGGRFLGGFGMNDENRLKTASGLSEFWDGSAIRRVRQGDGAYVLRGRRTSLHLMVQPGVAMRLLGDQMLADQGLLSRMLISFPESTIGKRLSRDPNSNSGSDLERYHKRICSILTTKFSLVVGTRNQLSSRLLPLSARAQKQFWAFHDEVEKQLVDNGYYAPIRGLGAKLPEHACRLAAVVALFEDLQVREITEDSMLQGINLARYYATEALRLQAAGAMDPDIVLAEQLIDWLHTTWNEPLVSLPTIYQNGPRAIRDKKTAKRIAKILEDHGWLSRVKGGAEVRGVTRKEVWSIATPAA